MSGLFSKRGRLAAGCAAGARLGSALRVRPSCMPLGVVRRAWLSIPLLLGCGRVSLGSLEGVGGSAGADASALDASGGSGSTEPPVIADAGGAAEPPRIADAGVPYPGPTPPSCGAALSCGAGGSSCCEARRVPAGTFNFGVLTSEVSASIAHVSEFYLDTFEVTVGRYRAFLGDYDRWRAQGNPSVAAAAHPRIDGSGWQASWSAQLPLNSAALEQAALACQDPAPSTWAAGASDAAPMNCLTWYEAFAFCAWDGGRLPTLAEIEYAAAGGSERRLYPWGSAPAPTSDRAVFACTPEDGAANCSPLLGPPAVGSRPLGMGRWGQHDIAGSLSEWQLDLRGPYPPECTDCVFLDEAASLPPGWRAFRGGSWDQPAINLELGDRQAAPADADISIVGLRCARDAP